MLHREAASFLYSHNAFDVRTEGNDRHLGITSAVVWLGSVGRKRLSLQDLRVNLTSDMGPSFDQADLTLDILPLVQMGFFAGMPRLGISFFKTSELFWGSLYKCLNLTETLAVCRDPARAPADLQKYLRCKTSLETATITYNEINLQFRAGSSNQVSLTYLIWNRVDRSSWRWPTNISPLSNCHLVPKIMHYIFDTDKEIVFDVVSRSVSPALPKLLYVNT